MARRLFLFTTGDFPSKKTQDLARSWVEEYKKELLLFDLHPELFDPWTSRIEPSDKVQIFGFSQIENCIPWRQRCSGLILTAWPQNVLQEDFPIPSSWKLWFEKCRKWLHPDLHSFEEVLKSVDCLILDERSKRKLSPKTKGICSLPASAKELAKLVKLAHLRGVEQ